MDFLKRHYEKVILVGLFLLFIGLMLLVQSIIGKTRSVSDSDLKLPTPKADHEVANPADRKFDVAYMWDSSKLVWNAGIGREAPGNIFGYSDLVNVFQIAECPYCKEKSQGNRSTLIPLDNFSTKDAKRNCPVCNTLLQTPAEKRKIRIGIKTEDDSDGDGIPNQKEVALGLDSSNPSDALYDKDKDGFSNIFEIEQGTDPSNPMSHPPFYLRLRLKDIKQVELPVKFMAVADTEGNEKKDWTLQFNEPHPRMKKIRSFGRMIGDEIKIISRNYIINDVEKIVDDKQESNADGKAAAKYKVYLTEQLEEGVTRQPEKLVMVSGAPAYSSDKRPVIIDLGYPGGKEYIMHIGGDITIGELGKNLRRDPNAGKYRLEEVDSEKMIAKFSDPRVRAAEDGSRPLISVSAEGGIPSDFRVIVEEAVKSDIEE